MSSANWRIVGFLAMISLYAASFVVWTGCEKIGCGKQAKKPMPQATQPDTTYDELLAAQPDVSTPPPQTQRTPQVVTDADGNYTVQVSSWRTRRMAELDAQRYISRGFDAYIQQADIPEKDGTWYRVRVGRFATKNEAAQMAAQLAGLLESGYWLDRVRQ